LTDPKSKPPGTATIAALRNVQAFYEAVDRAQRRMHHLPGLVVFHGPSGWGKTFSAQYAAQVHRAYYVEVRSVWTKLAFCKAVLAEMGLEPAARVYDMVAQISEGLAHSRRPLIIDEADQVLGRGYIEVIRDIHEASGSVVAMIGEERLPAKLKAAERVHNRVIAWVAAVPTDMDDARALAEIYAKRLTLADDLLNAIVHASRGGARRICANLEDVVEEARRRPQDVLDLAWWGDQPFKSGDVQPRATPWRPAA